MLHTIGCPRLVSFRTIYQHYKMEGLLHTDCLFATIFQWQFCLDFFEHSSSRCRHRGVVNSYYEMFCQIFELYLQCWCALMDFEGILLYVYILKYTKSLVTLNLFNTNFTNTHFQKVPIPHLTLEWPMLWRITKNSLHNEGIYKWVNWAPIFLWYKLLPTTSGPQKFAKIRVVKVDYFDFPGEIFEKLVWIRC